MAVLTKRLLLLLCSGLVASQLELPAEANAPRELPCEARADESGLPPWGLLSTRRARLCGEFPNAVRRLGTSAQPESCNKSWSLTSNTQVQELADLGCHTLQGLQVSRQVTSLAGLESITAIRGLTYIGFAKLSSLSGLQGLKTTGKLTIYVNNELHSLAGLTSLTTVQGEVLIGYNPKLTVLSGLESLKIAGHVRIYQNNELQSLAGLEGITATQGDADIFNNRKLSSLTGLNNLQTVGKLQIYQNSALASLAGLENLTSAEDIEIWNNPSLSSLSGLQSLQTTGTLRLSQNYLLQSLAGIDRLTAVKGELTINDLRGLRSLWGLQNLQTAGAVEIFFCPVLDSMAGLANLTTVQQALHIKQVDTLTSLVGLHSLRNVGELTLAFIPQLASLAGLERLAYAWGGVSVRACLSLRSLAGLSALYRTAQLLVWDSGPLDVLGGPFVPGAVAHKVEFDNMAWPRCITPHERAALVSVVSNLEFSVIPDATWERWRSNNCGWELFTCTIGRPCSFVLNGSRGLDLRRVFVSERNGGCGSCSGHRPRSTVTGGVVDFGYALVGQEAGHHSLCDCSEETVGPVAELLLRGPRQVEEPAVTVCSRGGNCTFRVDGEVLKLTDHVVLASSCEGGQLMGQLVGFTASWSDENEYMLHDPTTWYAAAPNLYQACWRAPCSSTADDGSTCTVPEENRYFKVGGVELHGAYARDYELVLGQDLSVPNIGFGVLDGDRMRLRRTCGEANEDGPDGLDAGSSGLIFDFGSLAPDRVSAGVHRLCWCRPRAGAMCDAEGQFMAESGEVRILCPAGHGFEEGRCQRCPAGKQRLEPGLESCSGCLAGQFSLEGETCEMCPAGTFAELAGSSSCVACQAWESADAGAVGCFIDTLKILLLALFLLSVGAFCATLVQVVRRRLWVVDVSLKDRRTIVTTFGSHGLSNFGRRSFPVKFHGTGHPGLDSPKEPFQARVKDAVRLELVTREGESIQESLDTSMGTLIVPCLYDLYHQGWKPVPTVLILLPLLLIMAVALGLVVLATDMAQVGAVGAAAAALGGTAASAVVRWRPQPTPLSQRWADFKMKFRKTKRCRCEKGPQRALAVGKLHDLLDFFREFIRDRTAYYLVSNIICPLTKASKMSYAEFVGAGEVEWFVSHFWGTPFEHFCMALQKHAETVCGEGVDWTTLHYWVCFCSNNQHEIADELGEDWRESSFYITLQSGLCHGTCMVLDDEALPLTRIWCIFELLQTVTLERNNQNFQGLLLCSSTGVLNSGTGSVEVAMALAQKVAGMDLRTAHATSAHDEAMIKERVVQEMGSFTALNHIVHHEVHDMLIHAQDNSNERFAAVLAQLDHGLALENL